MINIFNQNKKIDIYCPLCSPNKNITNIILSSKNNSLKIYCTNCDNIYFISLKKNKYNKIKVIMNSYNNTIKYYSLLDCNEHIKINQEIIVEDLNNKENIYSIKIQALENNSHKYVKESIINNINTIWCKQIDKVKINYSHQKKEVTTSFFDIVNGNKIYRVGDIINIKNNDFIIFGIYNIYKEFHKEKNYSTFAKNIKRVFVKEK